MHQIHRTFVVLLVALIANTTPTFTFGVSHTAGYGQSVTNVVSYTQDTRRGSARARFFAGWPLFLPCALKP
jgi:hypothetical protein